MILFTYLECNEKCNMDMKPVCGSNAVTYTNMCLLKYAECKNSSINLAYEGKCSVITATGKYINL